MRHEVHGEIVLLFCREHKMDANSPELIALIDLVDLDKFLAFEGSWSVRRGSNSYYITGQSKGKAGEQHKMSLHRFLMDPPEDMVVDHMNGNGLDNRRSTNLRTVTQAVNKFNINVMHARNTSGYRGVSLNKKLGRWRSACNFQKVSYVFGNYDTAEEAGRAAEIGRWLVETGGIGPDSVYATRSNSKSNGKRKVQLNIADFEVFKAA